MMLMERRARSSPAGWLPALLSAGVTFATAVVYVATIIAQGDGDVVSTAVWAGWIGALGACALVGALRTAPDRVIALGAATGGLLGAAVLSLFSIGALLLLAGICALVGWTRAGASASPRQQLLGGLAGVAAALGFSGLALIV